MQLLLIKNVALIIYYMKFCYDHVQSNDAINVS